MRTPEENMSEFDIALESARYQREYEKASTFALIAIADEMREINVNLAALLDALGARG